MEIIEAIGLRVIPEIKGFREKVESELKKIDIDFKIDIEIGKVDTKAAAAQIAKFREQIEAKGMTLQAKVELDAKRATAELDKLRAEATKSVKASDGLSLSWLKSTKSAVGLGAGVAGTTFKLGAMSVAFFGAVQAAGSLVTTVAQIVPILALLPGAALVGASSIAVLKLGMKGFSDVLKNIGDEDAFVAGLQTLAPAAQTAARAISDLKPQFDTLQLGVQEALFTGLGDEIRKLGDNYLPKLRAPLEGIGKVFGGMAGDVIAFLNQESTWTDLKVVFQATEDVMVNVRKAIFPVLQGLKDIGTVAIGMLPDLTKGFGAAAQKFQDWAARVRESGELEAVITQAIDTFKSLFKVIGNVANIIQSVFQAGGAGGNNLIGILEKVTGLMADFFNSAEGAGLLQNIFTAIGGVMKGLMPIIQEVARVVAEFIGPALLKLGPAIGLAFNALKPAIEPLGKALAALAPLIGVIAGQFANVLAAAIIALAPVIEALVPPLIDVVQFFGKLLTGDIKALAPVLLALAQVVGTFLVTALQKIGPMLPTFLDAMLKLGETLGKTLTDALPTITKVAEMLGQAFVDSLTTLIPLLPQIVKNFTDLLVALIPLLPEIIRLVTEALPQMVEILPSLLPLVVELAGVFVDLLTSALPFVTFFVDRLIPMFSDAKDAIIDFINGVRPIFEGVAEWVKGVIDVVAGFFTGDWDRMWKGAGEMVGGAVKVIGGILDTLFNIIAIPVKLAIEFVADLFGGDKGTGGWAKTLKDFVTDLPDKIFGGLGRTLLESGKALVNGFLDGVKAGWDSLVNGVKGLLGGLRDLFPFSPAKKGPFSGTGYTSYSGMALAEDFAKGIESNAHLASVAVETMMTDAQLPLENMAGFSSELGGTVDHALTVTAGATADGVSDAVRQGLSEAQFTIDKSGVFKVSAQGGLAFNRK